MDLLRIPWHERSTRLCWFKGSWDMDAPSDADIAFTSQQISIIVLLVCAKTAH